PANWPDKSGHNTQERGLPRAIRADNSDDLGARRRERDIAQRAYLAKTIRDATQVDCRHVSLRQARLGTDGCSTHRPRRSISQRNTRSQSTADWWPWHR